MIGLNEARESYKDDLITILTKLKDSISGDCYLGNDEELDLIDKAIIKAEVL